MEDFQLRPAACKPAAERAAFERLCYAYRNSVLSALREAEDAQVAFTHGYDRVQFLQIAVEGAKTAVDKLEESYGAGTVDFGRVYILQSQLLVQQINLPVHKVTLPRV